MPSPVFVGQYVYYFDFPNQVDLDFYPLEPREIFSTITSEEDIYTVECDRFSVHSKRIRNWLLATSYVGIGFFRKFSES